MRRRELLAFGAGISLGSIPGVRAAARGRTHIIVVGGGIVGAAIAYRLSARGARVTLLEKSQPAAGASGKSFAWINANHSKQPHHYHLLSRLGVHAFHRLQQTLGAALPVRFGGTLEWYADPARADELRRAVRDQQQWGYPLRFVDASAIAGLEPRLAPGAVSAGAFSELEGAVDSALATRLLLEHAAQAGAEIVYPCDVSGIRLKDTRGAILSTTQGEFSCDRLVLAAGADTGTLAALAGVTVPLLPRPGIVVRTQAQAPLIDRVLVTEDSHFHQQADGRVVIGDDFDPPATQAHTLLHENPLDFPDPAIAAQHGARILGQAARYLAPLAGASLESVALCWRPYPQDGFPVIGSLPRAPQLYVTVMHSGVTLAPLVAELAALELLDGAEVELLRHYRPARFGAGAGPRKSAPLETARIAVAAFTPSPRQAAGCS